MKRIVLLISSPGGEVFAGITAYNYLKGIPVEIVTHNFGSVDSIAAVLYCAGSTRYSVPHADFLLHPIALTISGAVNFDQVALEEQMKQMRSQTDSISSIIATTTKQKHESVQSVIEHRTTLNAVEAKRWGLVQEIRPELIPDNAQVISIQVAQKSLAGSNIGSAAEQTAFTQPEVLSFHSSPSGQGFTSSSRP